MKPDAKDVPDPCDRPEGWCSDCNMMCSKKFPCRCQPMVKSSFGHKPDRKMFVRCPNTCPHGDRCKFPVDGREHEQPSFARVPAARFCSMLLCPCNEPFDPFLTEFARRNASKPWDTSKGALMTPTKEPGGPIVNTASPNGNRVFLAAAHHIEFHDEPDGPHNCGRQYEHIHLGDEDTVLTVDEPLREDEDGPLLVDIVMDGGMLPTNRPPRQPLGVGEIHALGMVTLTVENAMALRDFLNRILSPEALKAKEKP